MGHEVMARVGGTGFVLEGHENLDRGETGHGVGFS